MPTRHLRKAWSIAAAVLLTAVSAPAAAPAAHGGGGGGPLVLMACAGTVTAAYAPGLTYVPKPTAITSRAEVGCPVSAGPGSPGPPLEGSPPERCPASWAPRPAP